MNESQLIARVIAGDRLAGRALYDTDALRVYSLAYRLSGDADKAREFHAGHVHPRFCAAVAVLGRCGVFDLVAQNRGDRGLECQTNRAAAGT